ncbi:phage tail sheath subtilisin-like domain-containing protein [Salmonella enterica subsp. enterica serovar Saintpaul]|nr:phage tail sheath subtilisin-like domain-containing protein [Salmonella enterica subsp. enterica serovar Saintpaul]
MSHTPWLINGSDSAVDALGDSGTLKTAINEAYANARVQVVGIRVEKSALSAGQQASIVAGMSAFALAQSMLKVHPRIFIAPEFSEDDTVGKALESIATRLSGVAYLDSPSMATMSEVVQRRDKYGERVEILRPRVLTADSDGVSVYRPYSAYAAGLRAKVDLELGFWHSKSNKEVLGFEGL